MVGAGLGLVLANAARGSGWQIGAIDSDARGWRKQEKKSCSGEWFGPMVGFAHAEGAREARSSPRARQRLPSRRVRFTPQSRHGKSVRNESERYAPPARQALFEAYGRAIAETFIIAAGV